MPNTVIYHMITKYSEQLLPAKHFHWTSSLQGLHLPFHSLSTMKRPNDVFVYVNGNSLKKRRRRKAPIYQAINYGQILDFGSTPSGSGSRSGSDNPRSSHTGDENQSFLVLGSPWVPPLRFKAWHPSTLSPGPEPSTKIIHVEAPGPFHREPRPPPPNESRNFITITAATTASPATKPRYDIVRA